MVDDILELVLDLLFDGTTALADAQKVPLAVRALLYGLLTAALMGIAVYLTWRGVQENSILLLLLASGMLIGSLVLLAVNLKKTAQAASIKNSPPVSRRRIFCLISKQGRNHQSTLGPAATSALPASLVVYLVKFFAKRAARSLALESHSAGSV